MLAAAIILERRVVDSTGDFLTFIVSKLLITLKFFSTKEWQAFWNIRGE